MRRSLAIAIGAGLLGLGAWAPPAAAIPVTITYSIGSGSFNGPYSTGPISGGTLKVLFPDAVSLFSKGLGSPGEVLTFELTGPSGYFRILEWSAYAAFGALAPSIDVVSPCTDSCGTYPVATGSSARITRRIVFLRWRAWGPRFAPRTTGYGHVSTNSGTGWRHDFTLGHEISRVPEPSTGGLLIVALLGLAATRAARRGNAAR